MINELIAAILLPGYVIGVTLSLIGLVGMVINSMLESYYVNTMNWSVSELPVWVGRLRFGMLWTARIGTFVISWTMILHCYSYMTNLLFFGWWAFVIILAFTEVCIILSACDIFNGTPTLSTLDERIRYKRKVEHAFYGIISPCVTFLFMAILTLIGVIWIW